MNNKKCLISRVFFNSSFSDLKKKFLSLVFSLFSLFFHFFRLFIFFVFVRTEAREREAPSSNEMMGSSSNTTNHREERVRARTKKKKKNNNINININKRKMSKEDEEEPRKVEFVLKSNISNNNRKVMFFFSFPPFFSFLLCVCLSFPRLIVREG